MVRDNQAGDDSFPESPTCFIIRSSAPVSGFSVNITPAVVGLSKL